MARRQLLDIGSWITIAVTLVLFAVALLVDGVPHDLLLEAGVFLVSAKLVIMSYKNALASDELKMELQRLREALEDRESN
jgi:Flp pilus assembly protein TadB